MSSLYMSHFPNFSLEGDHDQGHLPTLTLANDPSLIYPFMIDNAIDHDPIIEDHEPKEALYTPFMIDNDSRDCGAKIKDHDHHKINEHMFIAESSASQASFPSDQRIMANNMSNQQSSSNQYDVNEYSQGEDKWMSSKMRLMRKMMNDRIPAKKPRKNPARTNQQDQVISNNDDNPSNGIIRVCSACNTTKTPLWRSGPCGPKSLCNACGIRQRKARRAALMAANGGIVPTQVHSYKAKKEKRSIEADKSLPIKKRCKINNPTNMAPKKITTKDEIIISLSKNLAFHRVFPQDETDAAILLMALSCGLVRS